MIQRKGFTLIEIIGVLIIIAILATAIVPSLSGQVTRAYADAETISQETIGNGLLEYAKATQSILVTTAGWADSLVGYLEIPAADIARTKGQGGTRRLIVDPNHGLALSAGMYNQRNAFLAASGATGSLPTARPMNARFLIVSGLRAAAPSDVLNAAEFSAIWNQTAATPANFMETENLLVRRVSLASLFQPVTFTVVASAITWAPSNYDPIYFAWRRLPKLGTEWVSLDKNWVDSYLENALETKAASPTGPLPGECNNCAAHYSSGAVCSGSVCMCGLVECWNAATSPPPATSSAAAASSASNPSSASTVVGTPAWNLGGMSLTDAKNLPAGPSFTVFLLEGTLVNLLHDGSIVGAYVVNGPRSFVYDGDSWSE